MSIKDRYESLQPCILSSKEKEISITELSVYPLKGCKTTGPADYIDIGPYGPKYDRDLALIPVDSATKVSLTAWRHLPMSHLRQSLSSSIVTFTTTAPQLLLDQGLPVSIEIDLDQDPEKVGPFQNFENNSVPTKGFKGHVYPDEVGRWFSVAVSKEVVLIRAPNMWKTEARFNKFPHGRRGDLVKSYTSESPLNIVNDASIRNLQSRTQNDDVKLGRD